MEQRELGGQGLRVSALGYGCMGLTTYGGATQDTADTVIAAAVDAGITMFDTADIYGEHTNEIMTGQALRAFRDRVAIATKFGQITTPEGRRGVDGSPEHARTACDGSLMRLGVDVIDLWYLHRRDPDVPIEETVGAMSEQVAAGKVRYIGLSEVGADTIRRAHAVHPLTAVQTEYSLWTRDVQREVLPTVRELGVGFVAYSPLGRGFLTGTIRDRAALGPDDGRLRQPRFSEDNLPRNLELLRGVEALAADHGRPPSQIALAWVLAQGDDIVAIPGTTSTEHLATNLGALDVELTDAERHRLDQLMAEVGVAGDRYPPAMMAHLDG